MMAIEVNEYAAGLMMIALAVSCCLKGRSRETATSALGPRRPVEVRPRATAKRAGTDIGNGDAARVVEPDNRFEAFADLKRREPKR